MRIGDAKEFLAELIARYGDDMPLLFGRLSGNGYNAWGHSVDLWLEELTAYSKPGTDNAKYIIHTGDGHLNPVERIQLVRSKRGRYGVAIHFDPCVEYGEV